MDGDQWLVAAGHTKSSITERNTKAGRRGKRFDIQQEPHRIRRVLTIFSDNQTISRFSHIDETK